MNLNFPSGHLADLDLALAPVPDLGDFLCVDRQSVGAGVTVRAPYIAWKRTAELLMDPYFSTAVYNRRGGRNCRVPPTMARVLRRIVTGLNNYERHPAFRAAGMLGYHAAIFPAFEDLEGDRPWRPGPPGRFVVLKPVWHGSPGQWYAAGQRVTSWSEFGGVGPDDWLCQESVHLAAEHVGDAAAQ